MTKSEELQRRVAIAAEKAFTEKGQANKQCNCPLAFPVFRALQYPLLTLPEDQPAQVRIYIFVCCDKCGAGLMYDASRLIGPKELQLAVGSVGGLTFSFN